MQFILYPYRVSKAKQFITKVMLCVLSVASVTAYGQVSPNQVLPSATFFTRQMVNTNGNWVVATPQAPDNINLLEGELWSFSKRGQGVMGVEVKLVGGDGGTANFNNGVQNQLAYGGQGGTVQFKLWFNGNTYGTPFYVAYGKHGESTTINTSFTAAGGGGATGMCLLTYNGTTAFYRRMLTPWNDTVHSNLGIFNGQMLASAGGGGGGWAAENDAKAGKGAGTAITQPGYVDVALAHYLNSAGQPLSATVSGGSSREMLTIPVFGKEAHPANYGAFNYNIAFYNNTMAIGSLQCGQGGGRPTYHSAMGPIANMNWGGQLYANPQVGIPSVIRNGGAGGSGLIGGGAGACSFDNYSVEAQYPGAGAGGSSRLWVTASSNRRSGWGGNNYCAYGSVIQQFLNNAVLTPGGITSTPQSGSFAYRTIPDTIPPVAIVNTSGTLELPLRHTNSNPNSANQVTVTSWPGCCNAFDNDSVQSTTFTKSTFTCADTGYHQIYLIVTDFAGNKDTSNTPLNVHVTDQAPPHISTYPLEGQVKWVDISNGPRVVTQSDFPTATDNCSSVVTYAWAPHTFDCADLAAPVNISYTITDGNGNSDTLNQRFIVVSGGTTENVYVDASATGANNGTSWADALTDLQDAFRYVCPSHRNIYIAQGTYYPDRGVNQTLNDRNASFTLRNGDKLYGGFPSGGSVLSGKDPAQYPVVLSGNINNAVSSTDNSYHVVTIPGGVSGTLLDGITITGGQADENTASFGGGIKLLSALADSINKLTLKRCVVSNNYATGHGAAVGFPNVAIYGKVTAHNSMFTDNVAGGNGGAFYSSNASSAIYTTAEFTNCLFARNTASHGGALYFQNTTAQLTNCTSGYNKAVVAGGALSSVSSAVSVRNTIMWADTAGNTPNEIGNPGQCNFTYSNIQGSGGSNSWNALVGTNNGFNIDANPQYNSIYDFEFPPSSPCRNTGLKTLNTIPNDIRGVPRVVQDTIDMGAYELNPIVFVAADAPNGGDGNTWATAFNKLSDGLDAAFGGYYTKDVWIKAGTYRPDRNGSTNTGRFNTFSVYGSTKLYGGFAGNESSLQQRNIPANLTILDGDIGILNDSTDNAYHVITLLGTFPGFDGLIIQNGNADHATLAAYQSGGAMYHGGIAFMPTPAVRNCVFRNNSAYNGGAIEVSNHFAGYTLNAYQCLFYNNYAKYNGGAIYVMKSGSNNINVTCNLYNCTGAGNIANGYGGGFVETINIDGSGNAATNIYNSTLWGNYINQNGNGTLAQEYHTTNNGTATSIYNSHVGGGNPDFVNIANPEGDDGQIMTDDDGLALQTSSAAINLGNNANLPEGTPYDIRGKARVGQGQIDAGAYENWGCLGLTTLYVDSSIVESGTGANWATAYKYLSDALKTASACPLVENIHIAKGTYYPSGTNEYWAGRDTAFYINRAYNIYGGYPSGGGIQDAAANATILTGDINSTSSADNAYHILIIKAGTADTTMLDGLTFTHGNASQNGSYMLDSTAYSRSSGGAVVSNTSLLHINNCVFKNNSAFQGGAAVYSTGGTITSTHCVFENNNARYGGALRIEGSGTVPVASVASNIFYSNTATTLGGGAISLFNGSSSITNNLFAFDSCIIVQQGGAINITGGKSFISGNTFFKNYANSTGGGSLAINATTDTQFVANNIFYGNRNSAGVSHYNTGGGVTVSLIANQIDGVIGFNDTSNLKGTDNTWATYDDGLVLVPTAPILNMGNNSYTRGVADVTGTARVQYGIVDPGAYESSQIVTQWYVSAMQDTASQNGTSWATAFQKFEDGIAAAKTGDSVWVAQGTYTPANNTSFSMKAGVKIFGGFAGNETNLAQRHLSNGCNAVLNGNNACVFSNNNIDSSACLNGFVIRNGTSAQGGGMLNNNASPLLINLVFTDNNATNNGGAIANINSVPRLQNIVFYNNSAANAGGAIYDSASNAVVVNSTFYSNAAASGGGIFNNLSSTPVIANSLFNSNTANVGSDVSPDNTNVNYCLLQTAGGGTENIVSDNPFFVDPFLPAGFDGKWFTADDGLQVGYLSPVLNRGSNILASDITTDATGAARLQNGTVDMGAYESALPGFCDSAALNSLHVIYVDGSRAASGDGSNWQQAYRTLNEALAVANYCTSIDSVLVARGNYYPTGYQSSTNRTATFSILRSGLFLKGGYPSGGGDRNLTANNTILNGDIGMQYSAADNSYHVVTFTQTGISVIDGFIITNGNADSIPEPFNSGGGVYVNGTTVNGNTPIISNCVFTANRAAYGAGMYNDGFGNGRNASPVLTNCVFVDDTATTDGGAIYNNGKVSGKASPQIVNCTFSRNYAMGKGGAIYDAGTSGNCATKIVNTILWGNSSASGTAAQQQVYNDGAIDTASYSLLQNGVPTFVYNGGQNISAAPIFAADSLPIGFVNQWMSAYNGLALKLNSPGLQAGNAAIAPATDIVGILRQPLPDMGAYQNNGRGTGAVVQNVTACDSFLSPGYNHIWHNSGSYTDTLFNILGCDTFYQTNLTIYHAAFISQTVSTCGSYQIAGGHYTWDTTGIYYDTLQTINGCDSVIMLDLTITGINDSVQVNGAICAAAQSGASYQWIDCNNSQPIDGATSQLFTATQNGNYACVVTEGGCSDTTNCVAVTILEVNKPNDYFVKVFPNPTAENIVLTHNYQADVTVRIIDNLGRMVMEGRLNTQVANLNISSLATGIYQLQVWENGRKLATIKVMKN